MTVQTQDEKNNIAKGDLTAKKDKSQHWLDQFLAAHPDVQEHMDRQEVNQKKQLTSLQNQFNFIYDQEKKLSDLADPAEGYKPNPEAIATMNQLRTQMTNIVKGVGEKPNLPPGTVSLGEGEDRIDISEDEFNRMLKDHQFMQDKVQEYSQLPGGDKIVDHLASMVGQDVVQNGQQQASPNMTNQAPTPTPITPVPSQQLGGVDALKSTIKNFLNAGLGGGPVNIAAQDKVNQMSAGFKSANNKGLK